MILTPEQKELLKTVAYGYVYSIPLGQRVSNLIVNEIANEQSGDTFPFSDEYSKIEELYNNGHLRELAEYCK